MLHTSNCQEEQCTSSSSIGVVGFPFSQVDDHFLYLNTGGPADCSGDITSFTYCYYSPPTNLHGNDESYRTNLGVYRPRTEGGSTVYDLVSRVLTVERSQAQVDSELNWDGNEYSSGSTCPNVNLTEPVTVNAGDVLGACVRQSSNNVNQLDIVGRAFSSLVRTDTTGCTDTELPQSVTSVETASFRVLHLHATICEFSTTFYTKSYTQGQIQNLLGSVYQHIKRIGKNLTGSLT